MTQATQILHFGLSATIAAPVTVELLGEAGAVQTLAFTARFKRLKKSQREALQARLSANSQAVQPGGDGQLAINDTQLLDEVLAGWDLADATGQAVASTPQARAAAEEELPGLEAATVVAFFSHAWSVESVKAAAAKNSPKPSTP